MLSGRYGKEPEAESVELSLRDCHMKLGLKPTDFVSVGMPDFFKKSYDASGRYLVYRVEEKEVQGNPLWKAGYYLLPKGAAEVLQALDKTRVKTAPTEAVLALQLDQPESELPPDILKRAVQWGKESQPLFFRCGCSNLELKVFPPWGLRRRWKMRLRCPKRCQPTMTALL